MVMIPNVQQSLSDLMVDAKARKPAANLPEFLSLLEEGEPATFSPSPYLMLQTVRRGSNDLRVFQADGSARSLVVTEVGSNGPISRKSIALDKEKVAADELEYGEMQSGIRLAAAGIIPLVGQIATLMSARFGVTFPNGLPDKTVRHTPLALENSQEGRRVRAREILQAQKDASVASGEVVAGVVLESNYNFRDEVERRLPGALVKIHAPKQDLTLESKRRTGEIRHYAFPDLTYGGEKPGKHPDTETTFVYPKVGQSFPQVAVVED